MTSIVRRKSAPPRFQKDEPRTAFPNLNNTVLTHQQISELLKTCSNLKKETTCQIQATLNAFIASLINAERCFLSFPSEGCAFLKFKVLGKNEMREIQELPLTEEQIDKLLLKRQKLFTEDFSEIQLKMFRKWMLKEAQSILCVPIVHTKENGTSRTLFVFSALNKKTPIEDTTPENKYQFNDLLNKTINPFTLEDSKLIEEVFVYVTTVIVRNLSFEDNDKKRERCNALLEISENFLGFLNDPDGLLKELVEETKDIMDAERCSVYLVDRNKKQLVGKIVEGLNAIEAASVRLPIDTSIVAQAYRSGKMVNLTNRTNKETKNSLIFPVKHGDEVVAVVEICNKRNDFNFKSFDEELADGLSIFYAMSIL